MTVDLADTAQDIRRRCFDSGSTWVYSDGANHGEGSGLVYSDCGRLVSTEEIGNSERGVASWVRSRIFACRQFGTSDRFVVSTRHSDAQNAAVAMAVGSYLCAIVGGPGTGKTHVIKRIIELSGLAPEEIALCSFTAAAAKRMTASTGMVAKTVHKTLCVTKDGNFLYNRANPLPYRLLVVDEASTLDIPLANSLLRSVPLDCRVVLVGDDDQFPSIGPGNFFSDIISLIPCIRLRKIFRSEPDGLIASECRAIIRHGKTTVRTCNSDLTQCFAKVATSNNQESARKAADIASFLIKRGLVEPKDIRIITPFWSEIETVNECEAIAGVYPYTPYLCTKNDYKAGCMNGEIGVLKNKRDDMVSFESGYLSKYAGHVRESYAQTSFSSQGNEWECVIFLVGHTPKNQNLDRACAYVSVSRARRSAFVVGDLTAYKEIIARPRSNESRLTLLQSLITKPN